MNKLQISKSGRLRQIVCLAAAALSLGALLVACSASAMTVQTEDEPVEISFSWWGNDERHIYTMSGVDSFEQLNPDIRVNCRYGVWDGYEKRNRVWMESREQADVMQINYAWLEEYSQDGDGYYDLYQLADYIDLDNFTEAELAYGERDGKLNAIPIAFNTLTLYYDQAIFDRYGLDLPTTWDDFFTAAAVMREDGIYPLGMAKKQLCLLLLSYYEQSTGEAFFDENGHLLADEEGIAMLLEFYQRLLDEKVVMPLSSFSNSQFIKGGVAGIVLWVSDADKYCGELEANGGQPVVGAYPMLEGATRSGWYRKPATMYAISTATEQPVAAAKLLNFLLNSTEMAKLQATEKGVPTSRTALNYLKTKKLLDGYSYQADQQMKENSNIMGIMIPAMENENVVDAVMENAAEYLYGMQSLSECAQTIGQDIERVVEQVYG
jgi:oligogalacturonide transport system substrate-binding protein